MNAWERLYKKIPGAEERSRAWALRQAIGFRPAEGAPDHEPPMGRDPYLGPIDESKEAEEK